MKRILIGTLAGFLALAAIANIAGLATLSHDGSYACPLLALSSNDCTSLKNTLGIVLHHLSQFQMLTQGIFSGVLISFTLGLALIVFSIIAKSILERILSLASLFSRSKAQKIFDIYAKSNRSFLQWIALHTKRDPFPFAGLHSKESTVR
ncbi:MAG: hypothetical protein HYW95_00700 [Candidatus Wildermuthbacteria bacterium]|nr:hypothetical protein [Candidatus Wildermuthbacteria bacterium]